MGVIFSITFAASIRKIERLTGYNYDNLRLDLSFIFWERKHNQLIQSVL